MKLPDGYTLQELAEILGIPKNTVSQRIHVKKIKPIARLAIYPPDTLDRIREAPMGRPPKAKPEEP
jgi:predicted ArsR family transcriptional regulator